MIIITHRIYVAHLGHKKILINSKTRKVQCLVLITWGQDVGVSGSKTVGGGMTVELVGEI